MGILQIGRTNLGIFQWSVVIFFDGDAMKPREVTREDFDKFKELQVRKHWFWPAKFSTNANGDLWPWVTNGKTPKELRIDVRRESPLLDEVAGRNRSLRNEGGRIFINYEGAYWRTERDDDLHLIVAWRFADEVRPRTWTLQERLAEHALMRSM